MWEHVFYFLKIAQAVTFQVAVFKEQYNLADYKGGGEYFDLLSQTYLRNHLAHLPFHTRESKV